MKVDLRLGRWQDVLADVERVDSLICDPPYSQRCEDGFQTSKGHRISAPGMGYDPINENWCRAFVDRWKSITRGWLVICCDHVAWPWWEKAAKESGRCTFPPVVIAKTLCNPRMSCDGPGSHCEYIMVARPRRKEFIGWGSLPGHYKMQTVTHGHGHLGVSGAKSIDLMRALVRDYSRAGDLVCDPFSGSGTTARACVLEGRRFIGSEMDPKTHAIATDRLRGLGPMSAPQANLFAKAVAR